MPTTCDIIGRPFRDLLDRLRTTANAAAIDRLQAWSDYQLAEYQRETAFFDAGPRRKRTTRKRPSVTRYIKQARKAGDRGPVRIELPDGTTITSSNETAPGRTAEDDAERMWMQRVTKHAPN